MKKTIAERFAEKRKAAAMVNVHMYGTYQDVLNGTNKDPDVAELWEELTPQEQQAYKAAAKAGLIVTSADRKWVKVGNQYIMAGEIDRQAWIAIANKPIPLDTSY